MRTTLVAHPWKPIVCSSILNLWLSSQDRRLTSRILFNIGRTRHNLSAMTRGSRASCTFAWKKAKISKNTENPANSARYWKSAKMGKNHHRKSATPLFPASDATSEQPGHGVRPQEPILARCVVKPTTHRWLGGHTLCQLHSIKTVPLVPTEWCPLCISATLHKHTY